jgi:hypothetical protein
MIKKYTAKKDRSVAIFYAAILLTLLFVTAVLPFLLVDENTGINKLIF